MQHPLYKLDSEGRPVPCSPQEWSRWYTSTDRKVDRTRVGGSVISTVFMGTNFRVRGSEGPPILYETRVFGGPLEGECVRTPTRAEALTAHHTMVERVRAALRAQS